MRISEESNCVLYLSGFLKQMPSIEENYSDDIVITIQRYCVRELSLQNHRVIINQNDALNILRNGVIGMPVTIRGGVRSQNETEIVAYEIDLKILQPNPQRASVMHVLH